MSELPFLVGLKALQAKGIAAISINYSGSGDSGQIDDVVPKGADGVVLTVVLDSRLVEQLENWAYNHIPAGFEIDDGGYGELEIDLTTLKATLRHTNYVMSEESDPEQEFQL